MTDLIQKIQSENRENWKKLEDNSNLPLGCVLKNDVLSHEDTLIASTVKQTLEEERQRLREWAEERKNYENMEHDLQGGKCDFVYNKAMQDLLKELNQEE